MKQITGIEKKIFKFIDSREIEDFPILTVDELILFFTGSYQMIQAVYYLAEIVNDDDTIEGGFYNYQGRHILRYDVQSRHINSKQYQCYVEYIPYKNEIGGIKDYACDCANGKRTVGTCGHFASIIFFLSYARFESKIIRPAEFLNNIIDKKIIEDILPTEESEDEENDEEINDNQDTDDYENVFGNREDDYFFEYEQQYDNTDK